MRVESTRLFGRWMETRLPFKYGIATLTALPHVLVQVVLSDDSGSAIGQASDGLAPKWFTKNPQTAPEDDIAEMVDVIRAAARHAEGMDCDTPFELWRKLARRQANWAQTNDYPPLLWHFGVSLVERAVIQAWCRLRGESLHAAVLGNSLGIDLGRVHAELEGLAPSDLLPRAPRERVSVRHTVGLGDPLTRSDASRADTDLPADGLPVSLEDNIATYGLRFLKIKIRGEIAWDAARLASISDVVTAAESRGDTGGERIRFTLDGNEQFDSSDAFREHWATLSADREISSFLERVIFVEQPVKRARAFADRGFADWQDGPPVIIDESDGEPVDLQTALSCGYRGTSHKNCKGVFKGIAHACLLQQRNRSSDSTYILSAEDLANVGPLALLQDLHTVSVLGTSHVERNGHHYFRGLSMWSRSLQEDIENAHPGLYRRHGDGFATVRITDGDLDLRELHTGDFGPLITVPESELAEITDHTPADLSSLPR